MKQFLPFMLLHHCSIIFVSNEPDIFYLIFQINDFQFSENQLLLYNMEFKLFWFNLEDKSFDYDSCLVVR